MAPSPHDLGNFHAQKGRFAHLELEVNRMNRYVLIFLSVSLTAISSGCRNNETVQNPSAPHMTQTELAARFPYDLGPGTVNVSAYPREIKDGYKMFLAVCSSCHTSARPLNSPYTGRADWNRFVHRMHVKMENRGMELESEEARQIVDFLVYDSKVRKVQKKAEFEARQKYLKQLFAEVSKERDRLLLEETKNLPKKETPYVGVK